MSKRQLLVGLMGLLVFGACQSRKLITPETTYAEMKPSKVLKALDEQRDTWDTYSARVTSRYEDKFTKLSFTAKVRMKRDSVFWVTITAALGIEVGRAKITPDRVLFFNRLNKTYLDSDFEALSQEIGAPITFETLQSIFSGSPLFDWKRSELNSSVDSNGYVLSNHPPVGRLDTANIVGFIEKMFVSKEKLEITEQVVIDPAKDRYLEVFNSDYTWVGDRAWPTRFTAEARDSSLSTKVQMRANKVETDIVLSYPFEIPDNYAPLPQ
ncbi:DUF4292 domain-containing protein [Cryomorphaceae bacterium]|nr:DUF4292 domain-containing protein [Cryomorphaceae bacterium]